MNHTAKFWDRHAERYAKSAISDEASYQRKLKTTQDYLRPDMEVLELGCGTGSTAIVHAPFVHHVHATDVSGKMLEIAKGKADAAGINNITFEQSTIEALDVPSGSLDVVLTLSVLHLLEDKERAIAKVHEWLKPGGLFITSTPCLGETMVMKIFKVIGPVGKALGLLPPLKVFTVSALLHSLTSADFLIEHQWQPGKGKAVFIVAKKPT